MKILLFAINGSYSHTNLAIRCLKNSLTKNGIETILLERNLRDNYTYILQDLQSLGKSCDAIGFSSYIWNIDLMLNLGNDLKKILPNVKFIYGGPEVSFDLDRFNNLPFIDSIITNEGEDAIIDVINDIKTNSLKKIYIGVPSNNVMKNEGILYSEGDYPKGSYLYYESSRGCPFNCAYCLSSANDGFRYKSVKQTLTDLLEFEKLPEKIKVIKFVDRTFNFNQTRANEIWKELLNNKYTKNYHFELCATLLNEESFDILSQFPKGKIQLEFGLQSTNLDTLKECSRHIDPNLTINNVKRIFDMGNIHVHLDLIAGLPYEDFNSFKKSFNNSYGCCNMLQLGFLKLLHGTKLREKAKEFGYEFLEKAPYTVLKSNWICYEELTTLNKVSDLLERFYESGNFNKCLSYSVSNYISPIDYYLDFNKFLELNNITRINTIPQLDAYRLIYEFAKTFLDNSKIEEFANLLHEDYSNSEKKKIPLIIK